MSGDVHVRFCERLGVGLPGPTHLSIETKTNWGDWQSPGSLLTEDHVRAFQTGKFARIQVKELHPHTGPAWQWQQKTLIDSSAVGSSTPGVLVPQRIPGIVGPALQRLTLRDVLSSATTNQSMVEYVKELAFTNAASPQVEGSAKSESALTFDVAFENVQTLAHWIPASKQILQDFQGLRNYIDRKLMYGLKVVEEAELLSGSGAGNHLSGLTTVATAYAGTYDSASDHILDRLRKAKGELEAVDEMPDFCVLNPVDVMKAELLKRAEGGAGMGAYLVGVPTGTALLRELWNMAVVSSNSMPANFFLLGTSTAATIYDSLGATIDVSESHSTYFVENKVAIRCEERLALVTTRASAFVFGQLP